MKIKNIEGLSVADLQTEVNSGGKFVIYSYAGSIIIMTFKRPSDIYFIKSDENAVDKGLVYSFISLVFGWWGIPWGPVYTIKSFITNFGGGKNMTDEITASITSHVLLNEVSFAKNV
jgi:hypothetical protein